MKFLSAIVLALAAVSAAFANPPQNTPAQKKMIKCAVQNEKTDMALATKHKMYADYKGRRYFFCCDGCPQAFKKNPEKYVKKAESIPSPKTPSKPKK